MNQTDRQTAKINESVAMYAFSADPITFGHVNIVERAARLFGCVKVAIGQNPDKTYLFSRTDRLTLTRRALAHLSNVEVSTFDGLLIDYAYEQCADAIIKGVRNNQDFDYEQMLHNVGMSQQMGIDTHVLFADPSLAHISSGAVKALQLEQGLIQDYVPLPVKVALEEKLSGQIILGVTGEICAGKSTVCKRLEEIGSRHNIPVQSIELDALAHQLLDCDPSPYAIQVREKVINEFGREILDGDRISRKQLGQIIFSEPDRRAALNEILAKPLLLKLRKAIHDKKGLLLLNGALIVEAGMLSLCNNRVLLVEVSKATQLRRLAERGHSRKDALLRIDAQLSAFEKASQLENAINKSMFGNLWRISGEENEEGLEKAFHNIRIDCKIDGRWKQIR